MKYTKKNKRQQSFGQAIGILLIECDAPFVPGDVGNATTFDYPVRYKPIYGWTFEQLYTQDQSMKDKVIEMAKELEAEGVRAITGDCGYMAQYQEDLANAVDIPVFMSSLMQVPFISRMLKKGEKVGVLCANSEGLADSLLRSVGIDESCPIAVSGLEKKPHFHSTVVVEDGNIDTELMEKEVVEAALELIERDPSVKAILLECSMLPPYSKAVQEATGLPVFDFITMIDHVYSSVVQRRYDGYM